MAISKATTSKADHFVLQTSGGVTVTVRKMKGKDMLKVDKLMAKKEASQMDTTFRLIEMLSVEPHKITYSELEELDASDITELAQQLQVATGGNA